MLTPLKPSPPAAAAVMAPGGGMGLLERLLPELEKGPPAARCAGEEEETWEAAERGEEIGLPELAKTRKKVLRSSQRTADVPHSGKR